MLETTLSAAAGVHAVLTSADTARNGPRRGTIFKRLCHMSLSFKEMRLSWSCSSSSCKCLTSSRCSMLVQPFSPLARSWMTRRQKSPKSADGRHPSGVRPTLRLRLLASSCAGPGAQPFCSACTTRGQRLAAEQHKLDNCRNGGPHRDRAFYASTSLSALHRSTTSISLRTGFETTCHMRTSP